MRSAIFAFSAILAGIVSAQTGTSIPTCAQSCVTNALPASCNLNPTCICNTASFISGISCCIFESCDPTDQQAALAYAHTICDPVGGSSLLPVSAGCTANSTASSTGTGTGTSSNSATTTGSLASASGSASTASSAAGATASNVSASLSSAASTASQSASGAATSSNSSPAAGGRLNVQGMGLGAVGAAFLGLAALL